jgi:hypothetical protein
MSTNSDSELDVDRPPSLNAEQLRKELQRTCCCHPNYFNEAKEGVMRWLLEIDDEGVMEFYRELTAHVKDLQSMNRLEFP